MSWRLETWQATINLATCTPAEYEAAVSCSTPTETAFRRRCDADDRLTGIELDSDPVAVERRRIVEAFLYDPQGRLCATYHRDRQGHFVLASSPDAISSEAA